MKKLLTVLLVVSAAFAAEGYKVLNRIKIGGGAGWDYATMDNAARRLYVSHGTSVAVVDVDSGKVVGTIGDLQGVHGIALAPELNRGFITNGRANNVVVFDMKTLQKIGQPVATGRNPDAICYEPKTKRVFAINHSGNDATAFDAATGAVVTSFPLGDGPEFCVVDGAGKVYVNLEGSSETLEIDAAKPEVTRRLKIDPAEGPTGLAIDVKNRKLFAGSGNKMMAVIDIPTFKVIATPAIGGGTDATGFDPGTGLVFSSNGDGTLSIIKLVNGKYQTVDTVTTEPRARTLAIDEKLHRIYLPGAEYGPAPQPKEGAKKTGPPIVPDSFHVVVVGK